MNGIHGHQEKMTVVHENYHDQGESLCRGTKERSCAEEVLINRTVSS